MSSSVGAISHVYSTPQPAAGTPAAGPPTSGAFGPGRRIGSLRELGALLSEDRRAHGSMFAPGFQALAMQRFGSWAIGKRGVTRRVFRPVYLFFNWFVRSFHGIELPAGTTIGRRVRIAHQSGIVVHTIARIGDDCLIRQNVTIGVARDGKGQGAPVIGDRVEIGAGAVIVGAITIGDDTLIGANAVVRSDVPAGSVVLAAEPTVTARRSYAQAAPKEGGAES